MRKVWKIILSIFLICLFLIIYVIYNFYHNITDADKLNVIDCTDLNNRFSGTENCLYENLISCTPASNYEGFHILGRKGDKCKVMAGATSEDLYVCYFSNFYIDSLENENDLISLIANLKDNKECNKLGYSSFFLRRIWK